MTNKQKDNCYIIQSDKYQIYLITDSLEILQEFEAETLSADKNGGNRSGYFVEVENLYEKLASAYLAVKPYLFVLSEIERNLLIWALQVSLKYNSIKLCQMPGDWDEDGWEETCTIRDLLIELPFEHEEGTVYGLAL